MAEPRHQLPPRFADSPPSTSSSSPPDTDLTDDQENAALLSATLLSATPLFARVFHHSPVGMIITTPEGRVAAANDAVAHLFGRPPAALLGHTPAELGLRAADDDQHWSAPGSAKHRADVPLRLRGAGGRLHHLVASIQPIEINGAPYAVSLIQDLSEFRRLNDALAQSEQRFRLFFENAPLALVVCDDTTGEIVDVNPAACRQYGHSRAEFLSRPAEWLRPLLVAETGPGRHVTTDGRTLDVEVSTFTFELAERRLRMNALLDVTEQTAAAAALRESESRVRIVSQVSNDGLWDWDLTTGHVWGNNGIQLAGQTPFDAAQPWTTRIHPDDRERGLADFTLAVSARQPGWSSEFRVRRPDGTWATVLQRGVILYEGDRPVRVLGATFDITAPLQLAEAEAEAVSAERQRLARDLHDSVTQSLYSVSLLAEAARRHALEGPEPAAAEFITRLGRLAQQALRQMRLLVYELRPAVLDTEGLVGALRHRLDAVETRAGILVNLVIRGERPVPARVQGEMYRIAHEALNNALNHAAATAITVRLDTLGDNILLEVMDNGRGFDPQATHFGLGLSTMRARSAGLGGELTILSSPELGTTVRLTLPPLAD